MSHFTKLDQANITDKAAFIKACQELGLTDITTKSDRERTSPRIRGYHGNTQAVDVAVRLEGLYDVGLVQGEKGRWDMVADWTMMSVPKGIVGAVGGTSGRDLSNALLRLTTKHTLVATYRRQGFVARVVEDAEKNIQLTLTRG